MNEWCEDLPNMNLPIAKLPVARLIKWDKTLRLLSFFQVSLMEFTLLEL